MNYSGPPNLKKWGNYVRRLSRLLYNDTISYLIFDFLVDKGLIEVNTFAQIHSLNNHYDIRAALNKVKDHGLLHRISMRLDNFKSDYSKVIGLSPDEISSDKNSVEVYYFDVDLKFILKARLQ